MARLNSKQVKDLKDGAKVIARFKQIGFGFTETHYEGEATVRRRGTEIWLAEDVDAVFVMSDLERNGVLVKDGSDDRWTLELFSSKAGIALADAADDAEEAAMVGALEASIAKTMGDMGFTSVTIGSRTIATTKSGGGAAIKAAAAVVADAEEEAASGEEPKVPKKKGKKTVKRGVARSLADLAATGSERRGGEDAEFEELDDDDDDLDFEEEKDDETPSAPVDPVRNVGERLAEAMLAAQKFIEAVIESGVEADELKAELEKRYGLPGELVDACAEWAAVVMG